MASLATCYITEVSKAGDGYAIREDNDEDVFIGRSIVEKLDLQPFDEIEAIMQLNTNNPESGTKWFARRVRVFEDD